jgi:hypothetical protein
MSELKVPTTESLIDLHKAGIETLEKVEGYVKQLYEANKGLHPSEMDVEAVNKALKLLATSKSELEANRKPFTTKFDEIKRKFTSTENAFVELGKPLRTLLDAIAAHQAKEAKEREAKERLEMQRQNERKAFRLAYHEAFVSHVQELSLKVQARIRDCFNSSKDEKGLWEALDYRDDDMEINPETPPTKFITGEEADTIAKEVDASIDLQALYIAPIEATILELKESIPERLIYLEQLAKMDKAKAETLKKMELEATAMKLAESKQGMQGTATQLKIEQLENIEATPAKVDEPEGFKAGANREVEIVPLNATGWQQVLAMWFDLFGASCDDFEKMTFKKAITALKGEYKRKGMKVDSVHVEYRVLIKGRVK